MSNMVWAMATLGRSRSILLQRCAEEALRRGFSRYAPQAISNLVWGFAQLEYCNDAFLTVRESSSPLTAPALSKLPSHPPSGPRAMHACMHRGHFPPDCHVCNTCGTSDAEACMRCLGLMAVMQQPRELPSSHSMPCAMQSLHMCRLEPGMDQ